MLTINLMKAPRGCVYFIADDGFTRVKIGYSKMPRARLSEMQIGSPVPLRLMAMFRGDRNDEAMLHEHFASSRMGGEWFSLTPDLIFLIALLAPWRANTDGEELEPVRRLFGCSARQSNGAAGRTVWTQPGE